MIRLFFSDGVLMRFIEISSDTDELLQQHHASRNITLQHIIDKVCAQYGSVSEELLKKYLLVTSYQ